MQTTHWELSAVTQMALAAEHEKAIKLSVLKILAGPMQPAWPCPMTLRSPQSNSQSSPPNFGA